MTQQVTMDDGTERELVGHLRDEHHKGTRGLTEAYLSNLHHALHQRTREDAERVHSHPGDEDLDPAS